MQEKIECAEVITVYIDLLDGFGYYCAQPGESPFICLDNSLLNADDETFHQEVHRVLLEHHRSIPADSIYRLFTLVRYYEDLAPAPAPAPVKEEVIIVGRAIRQWNFTYYEFNQNPRVIGSVDTAGR
jgi:hypothetical protein